MYSFRSCLISVYCPYSDRPVCLFFLLLTCMCTWPSSHHFHVRLFSFRRRSCCRRWVVTSAAWQQEAGSCRRCWDPTRQTHSLTPGGRVCPVELRNTDGLCSAGVFRRRKTGIKEPSHGETQQQKRTEEPLALSETLRDGKFVQQPPVSVHGVQPRWVLHYRISRRT